jgi:putative oligomerization/nucleic acid binding protein
MIMRRRPLLRAAAVAGGAYIAGKRTANRQAEAEQQADPPPAAATAGDTGTGPAAEPSASSLSGQLNQLIDLHNQGTLTDEEFTAAKAKLLGM